MHSALLSESGSLADGLKSLTALAASFFDGLVGQDFLGLAITLGVSIATWLVVGVMVILFLRKPDAAAILRLCGAWLETTCGFVAATFVCLGSYHNWVVGVTAITGGALLHFSPFLVMLLDRNPGGRALRSPRYASSMSWAASEILSWQSQLALGREAW